MTTVVTGARGYLGRAVVQRLLAEGETVVALGRADAPGEFVDHESGRVGRLEDHMTGATSVVHLAGQLVEDRNAPVGAYLPANVVLTDDVAAAAVAAGAESLVHASSRLVYPATLTSAAIEDRDARPDTPYGLSKLWAEDVVRVRTAGSATSAVSLRIGQVTGGNHPGLGVINSFMRQARSKGVVTVDGSGAAVREVVHVDDVAAAIIAAAAYRGPWSPVNIGGTEPATVAQFAAEVASHGADIRVARREVEREDTSVFALSHERCEQLLHWRAAISWRAIIAEAWTHLEEAET